MAVDRGLLAILKAKPDKGDDLAALLRQARELAVQEEGTVSWYAFRLDDTTYGIFDTFETEEARAAHVNGRIPATLHDASADLLDGAPDIRPIDVLALKESQPGEGPRRRGAAWRLPTGPRRGPLRSRSR